MLDIISFIFQITTKQAAYLNDRVARPGHLQDNGMPL